MTILSVPDYRRLARRRLPPFLFEYIDGGASAGPALPSKAEDRAGIALRQRVLNDVSASSTATSLFGRAWAYAFAARGQQGAA